MSTRCNASVKLWSGEVRTYYRVNTYADGSYQGWKTKRDLAEGVSEGHSRDGWNWA